MAMLITERAIINPPRTTRVRHVPQTVALPEAATQTAPITSSQTKVQPVSQTHQRLGDRQSWMLLVLVLIPLIGAVSNLLTYGFIR